MGAGVRYGNMLLMNRMVSRHYTCAIRIRMSDKIQRLPVKFVDSTPVGQILEQMTDDVSAMGNSIHQIVDTLMQGLLQIVFIAAALLAEDWRLGLIDVYKRQGMFRLMAGSSWPFRYFTRGVRRDTLAGMQSSLV